MGNWIKCTITVQDYLEILGTGTFSYRREINFLIATLPRLERNKLYYVEQNVEDTFPSISILIDDSSYLYPVECFEFPTVQEIANWKLNASHSSHS